MASQNNGIFKKIVVIVALAWAGWISLGMVTSYINDGCFMTKLEFIEKDIKDIKNYFGIPN